MRASLFKHLMPQAPTLVHNWDEVVLSAARDNARLRNSESYLTFSPHPISLPTSPASHQFHSTSISVFQSQTDTKTPRASPSCTYPPCSTPGTSALTISQGELRQYLPRPLQQCRQVQVGRERSGMAPCWRRRHLHSG